MRNLLPFEKITYKTELPQTEIMNRLYSDTRYESFGKGFRNNTFKIRRIINYRNSFLPLVEGTITEENDGTTVNVKMKLHAFVKVFMVFWFGGVLLACLGIFVITDSSGFDEFHLIPFAMLLFGLVLVIGAFKFESRKTRKDLQEILQAEIISCKKESY